MTDDQLKTLVKAALVEVLEERRDLIQGLLGDALGDVALARAIEEGERTELVGRDEVVKLIERQE